MGVFWIWSLAQKILLRSTCSLRIAEDTVLLRRKNWKMPLSRLEWIGLCSKLFHAIRPSRIRRPLSCSVIIVLTLCGSRASYPSSPGQTLRQTDSNVPSTRFYCGDTISMLFPMFEETPTPFAPSSKIHDLDWLCMSVDSPRTPCQRSHATRRSNIFLF